MSICGNHIHTLPTCIEVIRMNDTSKYFHIYYIHCRKDLVLNLQYSTFKLYAVLESINMFGLVWFFKPTATKAYWVRL